MKQIIFILIFAVTLFLTAIETNAQCPTTTIHLDSQGAINNFASDYPGCTELLGDLEIYGGNGVTNLNGLAQIQSIAGYLKIDALSQVNSLTGLHNLTSIGGGFIFVGNDNLSNLNGLESLTSIEENLSIINNVGLINLSGLENLSGTIGRLTIDDNDDLQSLIALSGITSLDGGSFNAGNTIILNPNLTSLEGLENITTIKKRLEIDTNNALTSLNGLNSLENITDGRLYIINNQNLEDLSGLESLTSVDKDLFIGFNNSLTTIEGLNNLSYVGRSLFLHDHLLNSIEALSNLTEIDILSITGTNLSNLSGLENLTVVNGGISIKFNEKLTNIEGIKNIDSSTITISVDIFNNELLSQCSIESVCNYLAIPTNDTNIHDNLPGCNNRQEIEDNCELSTQENLLSKVKIHPNPTNGTFKISTVKEGTIKVIDSQGRIVKHYNASDSFFSVKDLSKGVYFVQIQSGNQTTVRQLIKN